MGRNPELIEKKRGRGTIHPAREQGKNLPALPTVHVSAPKWMPVEARKTFKHIAGILESWGVIQAVDAGLLEAYVMALHNFRDDQLMIQEKGAYVAKLSPQGIPVGSTEAPWSKSAKENARLIKDLGSKLGFSPVDRARILSMLSTKDEEKDDFAEFVEV